MRIFMQNICYSFLITALSLVSVTDLACMHRPNKVEQPIPTLSKLCITKLAQMITHGDLDSLFSPKMMSKLSAVPEELSKKVTARNFCHRFENEFPYDDINIYNYTIMLDEYNNRVIILKKDLSRDQDGSIIGERNKITSKLCALNGTEISSAVFSHHPMSGTVNDTLFYLGYPGSNLSIIKNGTECLATYQRELPCAYPKRLLSNQQKLHLINIQMDTDEYKKHCLFDLNTQTTIHHNVDWIEFDSSGNICMVKNGNNITVTHDQNYKIIIEDAKEATLSPDGRFLFVLRDEQFAQLLSVEDGKILFSFEEIEGETRVSLANFSYDGSYLLARQHVPSQGSTTYLLNTKSGAICKIVSSPHADAYFCKKYLVFKKEKDVCLIPIKKLSAIHEHQAAFHTFEDIVNARIGKYFTDFKSFHPSGKLIITQHKTTNYMEKLVDIKSGKIVFALDAHAYQQFSEPTGKIFYTHNAWNVGYQIFSLRNDFTMLEYVLMRFMSEKKITKEGLSSYPHMQKIYDAMDPDKRLFSLPMN